MRILALETSAKSVSVAVTENGTLLAQAYQDRGLTHSVTLMPLLDGMLHLDLAQGLTAFACGVFLGWLAERSGSILPGMLLHFCNNTLAFLNLYLRFYAPQPGSFGVELFILFFFPVFGVWLIWHARQQGFRFSAGLRPGVDVTEIFTSPVYDLAVVFLVCYTIFV